MPLAQLKIASAFEMQLSQSYYHYKGTVLTVGSINAIIQIAVAILDTIDFLKPCKALYLIRVYISESDPRFHLQDLLLMVALSLSPLFEVVKKK